MANVEIPERLLRYIHFEPNSGCWLWSGARQSAGYGTLHDPQRYRNGERRHASYAHRLLYELVHGPIPKGLQCDHLCRTPCCVNPAHIELVTPSVNAKRGKLGEIGRSDHHKLQNTHCPHGHPYDGYNLIFGTKANGLKYRVCRICANAGRRRWRRERRVT